MGLSEKDYCKKNPSTGGCEKYRGCCRANNAKCESCKQGISEEEFCKKNPSTDFFGGVQGCEKYHKGDGGKGCCKANTADCLACSEGKSVKRFCKKKRNRDVPGCEKYHRRGSWGKNDSMTAAIKGTGASEIGLADDLGSMSTVPFGCLLLSLPIRAALGVPFWRGFLGIHFKSM